MEQAESSLRRSRRWWMMVHTPAEVYPMRRRLPLAALLVLPLLGSDSPKEYDDRAQDTGIEGAWRFVYCETGGVRTDADPVWPCVYKGGKFTWLGHDEVDGMYKVNDRVRPARLTKHTIITDTTYKCIFRFDVDTLLVAYY
jgi:uncharacterized protein (TIGR03067 family)